MSSAILRHLQRLVGEGATAEENQDQTQENSAPSGLTYPSTAALKLEVPIDDPNGLPEKFKEEKKSSEENLMVYTMGSQESCFKKRKKTRHTRWKLNLK